MKSEYQTPIQTLCIQQKLSEIYMQTIIPEARSIMRKLAERSLIGIYLYS